MSLAVFDQLQQATGERGVDGGLAWLAEHCRAERQYHDLFDVRLMQMRRQLGLPIILTSPLDDLPADMQTRVEEGYLTACREVGNLLLGEGRLREAWAYLRPTGEKTELAARLAELPRTEENREMLIEIALHEGVHPRLGFELVLEHYGTCNAVTMFDAEMHARPKRQRQEVAALMVEHLRRDVLSSVKRDIADREGAEREGKEPAENSLAELVADREFLFEDNNYHIDTSHLAAVVRFALVLDDAESLRQALDLCEYGRRLSPQYQFPGEPPFVDRYPSHILYFHALLGEQIDEALSYFREQAQTHVQQNMTGPAEVYVSLLSRLGRYEEAMQAAAELLPPGSHTVGFAPSLLELARLGQRYSTLMELSRSREDLLGFAYGLFQQQEPAENGKPSQNGI